MMSLVTERRFRQRLEELSIVWHVNNHQPALAWAAAAVTWVAAPERDIMTIPKQLDALADALWKWADETGQPEPLTIEAVAEGFVALGFRGNTENYDDRRNSFLEDVLTRRVGIPITLSVVFIELAARFGLRCEGINFPGHFLVRYSGPDGVGYLDPFHQCQWLDSDGLQQLLQQMCGPQEQLCAEHLQVAQPADIFLRMLNNIYRISLEAKDWTTALRARRMQFIVCPEDPYIRRDIGLLCFQLERWSEAVIWLEEQKQNTMSEAQHRILEAHINEAKRELARWN
ncbi:transglutaminase family protein [Chloracidobacterium sp. D]|uniref:SirB1 family protein n=1 Tax=Chloracidobacterium sp. D TaxID=2821536 RepID=UPI001B8C920D|nr:transglutaminase-like domain-containing protein [Chloracidobacterium sp. D]QUV82305.1 transglutaminase family protein [Chloracidobacterium sp. D]